MARLYFQTEGRRRAASCAETGAGNRKSDRPLQKSFSYPSADRRIRICRYAGKRPARPLAFVPKTERHLHLRMVFQKLFCYEHIVRRIAAGDHAAVRVVANIANTANNANKKIF